MCDYPVVFRCSECATEFENLDNLESHIWNRHLRKFRFNCVLCSQPAITHGALTSHFEEQHPGASVEYKRILSDELHARDLIALSIVVPVYEDVDGDEVGAIYDNGEVPQIVDGGAVYKPTIIEQTVGVEEIDGTNEQGQFTQQQIMQGNDEGDDDIIYMDIKPQLSPYGQVEPHQHHRIQLMDGTMQNMHLHHNDLMMDESGDLLDDDTSYPEYSGHELLDDQYEYMEEDGTTNTIYISDGNDYPPHKLPRHIRLRNLNMKNHHLDMIVNRVANTARRRRMSTIWECPDCRKIVRYPSRIEEHRRSHTGEKPHACLQCGQRFAQKGALKCHMRTHTGERPYICTWDCGKSFVSASAQRMHEKQHSGERPFSCCVCGRLFGKRSHLLRHEQHVHRAATIDPSRRPIARGLEAAGDFEETLKPLVEGVVAEVQQERYEKAMNNRK